MPAVTSEMAIAADAPAPASPAATAAEPRPGWWSRAWQAVGRGFGRMSIWHWALLAAMAAYTVHFTALTLEIHHGTGSSSYDLGLYDQGVWLMSRLKAPFVTLMGRNLMGDHTSFILVPLVPFYWIWPAVGTLYFFQTAALAAGAVPVFLYATKRLGSPMLAWFCAMAYLLHPAVSLTNLENFHPDAFLGVLVGFAIYGALERKWVLYGVFVFLSLMVKEDVSLVIIPLGVWVALRRDRRKGLITIVASAAFMAFAMLVVVRSLLGVVTRNSWRIPFGGPRQFIGRTISHPGEVLDYFRSDGRPWYLWQMTAPFAWIFMRLPDVAMISALVLFTNIMSTYSYQYEIAYHYSLIAVPALAIGTPYAIGVITGRWRTVLVGVVAVAALWTSYLWGGMPWSKFQYPHWAPSYPTAVELREIIEEIPSNASVSAFHSAAPHLSHREEIYQFPNPFSVVLYGVDISQEGTRLDERSEDVDYVLLPTSLSLDLLAKWDVIDEAFVEVARNPGWVLYERNPDIELPPLPTDPATEQLPGG